MIYKESQKLLSKSNLCYTNYTHKKYVKENGFYYKTFKKLTVIIPELRKN